MLLIAVRITGTLGVLTTHAQVHHLHVVRMRIAGMMTEAMHARMTAAVAVRHEQRFVSRMSTMRITTAMMRVAVGNTVPQSITTMSTMITVHKKILRC
jgi:hypothetical protein